MNKLFLLAVVVFLLPALCMAHPGHGESGGFTITHYFVEPLHLVITAGAVSLMVVVGRWIKKWRRSS